MSKVRFVKEREIEFAALSLLAGYGSKYGTIERPPIPVEEILEAYLGLHFEIDDLPARLRIPNVLGATWVNQRMVRVDRALDPTVDPSQEGRYRFTVAHEAGHWELHRHLFLVPEEQGALFGQGTEAIVCRSDATDPMEWQANAFAGHLLMPKAMILEAWTALRGTPEPYVALEEIPRLRAPWRLGQGERSALKISRTLARAFKVSGQAMQIRLVGLGLIRTTAPERGLFSN